MLDEEKSEQRTTYNKLSRSRQQQDRRRIIILPSPALWILGHCWQMGPCATMKDQTTSHVQVVEFRSQGIQHRHVGCCEMHSSSYSFLFAHNFQNEFHTNHECLHYSRCTLDTSNDSIHKAQMRSLHTRRSRFEVKTQPLSLLSFASALTPNPKAMRARQSRRETL